MKKSSKGFTLVELIVVIAIIGVLAAILVPSLMGYVSDSKVSSANANAKQVYTAAATVATKCETAGYPISGTLEDGGVGISNGVDGCNTVNAGNKFETPEGATVKHPYEDKTPVEAIQAQLGSGSDIAFVVEFVKDAPESALAAKTKVDKYVGSYPTEAEEKCSGNITDATLAKMEKTANANKVIDGE